MKKILLLLFIFPLSILAEDDLMQPLSNYLIATGTNSSGIAGSPRTMSARELVGFRNKETSSTVDLTSSCQNKVIIKGELVGDARVNYLKLLVSNQSTYFKSLVIEEISFKFGEKMQRFPLSDKEARSSIELNPGWWVEVLVPFPSKKDFYANDEISVVVPIQAPQEIEKICGGRLTFKKQKNIEREYTSYNFLELLLDTSLMTGLAGNTSKLGTSEGSGFALDFVFYPYPRHGLGFGTYRSGEIESSSNELSAVLDNGENTELASAGYFLLYSYRLKKESFLIHSTTGLGLNSIEEEVNDSFKVVQESAAIMQKIYVTYLFNKYPQNDSALDFGLGLGLHAMYVPNQEIHGVDTSGLIYGLGARVYFGL